MDDCTPSARCVLESQAWLAESPMWSIDDQALYWIEIGQWPVAQADAPQPAIHRFEPHTGATRAWPLPEPVGAFALRRDGKGAVAALVSGIHAVDFETGNVTLMQAIDTDPMIFRFNDGRCDPAGRFWVGQVHKVTATVPAGSGALYRYDGHVLSAQVDNVTCANGLAWSPDGRTMYFADIVQRTVWAFDYDPASGTATNRRVFIGPIDFGDAGKPDGAAVDAEGGYWIAVHDAGKVARYRQDGTLDREIHLPVSKPTMVAFGGPNLETLYITTARHGLNAEALATQPQAGNLFACEPGVRGLPEPYFREID